MKSTKRTIRRQRENMLKSILIAVIVVSILGIAVVPIAVASTANNDSTGNNPIIGIDLGTTYSCVGVYKAGGKIDIIPNDQGNRITPSYVAFDANGERLVGDAAKNQATINPANTIFDIKRLIGRQYSDKAVQADKKLLPYTIEADTRGMPSVKVNQNGKEMTFTPEEISAMILQKMKHTAESYLGHEVKRAIITVPAYFDDHQRKATQDAGKIAGLEVERIINEPTAAAIAHGMGQNLSEGEKNILVYDLGGGTFDVTLLSIDGGVFEVLSTSGDTHLGGEDFDHRIMRYLTKTFQKKTGINILENKRAIQKLRKEVERAKRTLSSQTQARVDIEDLISGYDLSETISRARFEELNADLFKKTLTPVNQVLKDAHMSKDDVDEIVLVGGSTRIPRIQSMIQEYFGKEPSTGINPDEAVAYGAATQGAVLNGNNIGGDADMLIIDVTPLSQGIETAGGVMTRIIPRGTTVPTKKSQIFSTNQDNQHSVTIQVFQGERPMSKDNLLLGNFDLTGIPPAPRGVPQIEVTFEIDVNGVLQVSAADKMTGQAKNITITSESGRLTFEEIERMVEQAEQFAEEDRMIREKVDAKNGLESYVYNLKNTLEDNENDLNKNISAQDKKELKEMIDNALDWLDENSEADKEDYYGRQKDIEKVANPIMRKMYGGGGGEQGEWDTFDYGDDEL